MQFTCPNCKEKLQITIERIPSQQQVSGNRLQELLDSINMDSLDERELDFISTTRKRFAQYGNTTRMTEAQMAWLKKIAKKEF